MTRPMLTGFDRSRFQVQLLIAATIDGHPVVITKTVRVDWKNPDRTLEELKVEFEHPERSSGWDIHPWEDQ